VLVGIRDAELHDVEAIRVIRAEGWLSHRMDAPLESYDNPRWVVDSGVSVESQLERIRAWVTPDDGSRKCLVADSAEGVVGFAIAAACPGRHAIDALYVSRRGYGIGGALLECVCSWLGCRQDIYLEVPASSCWLVTFYGKHGFQLTGVESSAPVNRILNTSMPLYEMRRSAAEAHYGI
jgi:GNAT superfamily N-acetyltransferase